MLCTHEKIRNFCYFLIHTHIFDLFFCFLFCFPPLVSAGLASYPIDTIRRRMMMTSGEGVKYKGSFDCTMQILKVQYLCFLFLSHFFHTPFVPCVFCFLFGTRKRRCAVSMHFVLFACSFAWEMYYVITSFCFCFVV